MRERTGAEEASRPAPTPSLIALFAVVASALSANRRAGRLDYRRCSQRTGTTLMRHARRRSRPAPSQFGSSPALGQRRHRADVEDGARI